MLVNKSRLFLDQWARWNIVGLYDGLVFAKARIMMIIRPSKRAYDELRPLTLEPGVMQHAEGSCLVELGKTKILCTASIEEKPPRFLAGTGQGWVTAEYAMLPRATDQRTRRESVAGRQTGRSSEIQRLIGRSLRAGVDRKALGERQIIIDCDVLQADGGTRTAAITGGYIALYQALFGLQQARKINTMPLRSIIAAISCGIYAGVEILDLAYCEDQYAAADANFVLNEHNEIIEIQVTAESEPFSQTSLMRMFALACQGVQQLIGQQKQAMAKIQNGSK